ncbi:MAG: tetratricopeptide repeat protein [Polyangiaceae bacterium]
MATTRRFSVPAAFALSIAGAPSLARAGDAEDKASAEALFEAGRALLAERRYLEACTKLSASQNLDPAVGTLLNLAECYEKLGRTASAFSELTRAAELARQRGDDGRADLARQAAAALEPRLCKLIVQVSGAARVPGLEVLSNGRRLDARELEVGAPVDPGAVTVEVLAPGYQRWSQRVDVKPEMRITTVTVPQLTPRPDTPQPALPVAPPDPAADQPPPEPSGSGSTQRVLAVITLGVGAVGVGMGTVFGLRAVSKADEARQRCPGGICADPQDVALESEGNQAADISTVSFIVGGAGLVGGLVLWLTAPSDPEPTQGLSVRLRPTVEPSAWGLSVHGRM